MCVGIGIGYHGLVSSEKQGIEVEKEGEEEKLTS